MSKMTQNKSMADALLSNFNTILVQNNSISSSLSALTYKVPKDIDLDVDDFVLVHHTNGFGVLKVLEVHNRVKNTDEVDLKWIVSKVDTSAYDMHMLQDEKAMDTILELEARRTKRNLLDELTDGLSEEECAALTDDLGLEETLCLESSE